MVWALSYRPKPDSYPRAEVVEGNSGELHLEDMSPDGGTALGANRSSSGRRVKPESVPKVIRWISSRPLLDFENAWCRTVSKNLLDLICEIEPDQHQFEPVQFISKHGDTIGTRWFWQVCNRIDSVHRQRTNYRLEGTLWRGPLTGDAVLVFDLKKIGSVKFWHDKHLLGGPYLADSVKSRLEAARITGVRFLELRELR
jgi:hypothetical protein